MKPEAQLSKDVQAFLKQRGFAVWSTEQGYRKERGGTRQTPGIPDLIIMGHRSFIFVELKAGKAKLTNPQKQFRDECEYNGVPWACWRDVRDAFDWCAQIGVLTPEHTGDA